jgi:hypothetical protein
MGNSPKDSSKKVGSKSPVQPNAEVPPASGKSQNLLILNVATNATRA